MDVISISVQNIIAPVQERCHLPLKIILRGWSMLVMIYSIWPIKDIPDNGLRYFLTFHWRKALVK